MISHSKIFRKKALERSSSPERLDQAMKAIRPQNWLPLTALGSLVVAGVIWSVVGRIPITVTGQGVLIYPGKVTPVQSIAAGRLVTMNVKVGDAVKKGQILGTVDQIELQNQLQQQRRKLSDLESQNQGANSLQSLREQQELKTIEQQRQSLRQRLAQTQGLTPIVKDKSILSIKQQRRSLQQSRNAALSVSPTQKRLYEGVKMLEKQGAVSKQVLLREQQTYQQSLQRIADIDAQIRELDVRQVDVEKAYRENLSQINDLRSQLQELETKQKSQREQDFQSTINRQNQIQEVKRSIGQLELQLNQNSQIISQHNGRILEISAGAGQIIATGAPVLTIQAEEASNKLIGLTFFPVGEGKKIRKGMKVQITPTTVERERFGGIVGNITDVSAFPVSKEGALSIIGNAEVVQSLVSQGPQIQVSAELIPDKSTKSGYKWSSSKGPDSSVSSGTTTTVQVTTEERAPISFVFPILRSITGVQ